MRSALIQHYLTQFPPTVSVIHESSITLWKDHFDFNVCEIDGCLCVMAKSGRSCFGYWPPIGSVSPDVLNSCAQIMKDINPLTARIENISEREKDLYVSLGWRLVEKANEYVYLKQDIISYQGNRYKSQRHDVNLLVKNHQVSIVELTPLYQHECLMIYDVWQAAKKVLHHNDPIALDMLEVNRPIHQQAIREMAALGLRGILIYIDGKPAAYSLGYPLNQTTFVVLLEVADLSVKGLSAYIFNQMCQQQCWEKFDYVNVMDDFGLPNVAQTKKSFHPCSINPIYNAVPPC